MDLPWLHKSAPAAVEPVAAAAAALALPSPTPLPALPPGSAPNYRAIVQQYGPAVVGVTVEGTRNAEGDEADPVQRFLRGLPGARAPAGKQPFKGMGSGFIVAADGLIFTNAHVVKDAQEVTVRLADRREFSAKVLGSDATTDIAVLRIPAQGLPTVRLGAPKLLQVGAPVLAIGPPYGET
ncbi:MAG: peptidase, partial [Burkholderiales bacterium PBB5]